MKTPDLNIFAKAKDLKDRIVFTILALVIYRFGSYIPLPSINPFVLHNFNEQNAGGLLGMFNMLSGGSLGRMSIFALAIMPYITSSIIVQLLSVVVKSIEQLRKEGDSGRRKLNQYTRYLTVAISLLQGYGLAVSLEHVHAGDMALINNPGMFFRITSVVTLTTGTMFLMWLGEQITARGIGNGTSLIIFSGIVSGLPSAIASTLSLGKAGALSPIVIIAVLALIFGLIYLINFMEKASRKIVVQYPKRQVGNKLYGGESTHIPLKLNTAGVIPPIFASSLLLFPVTLANFATDKTSFIASFVATNLGHGKLLYVLLFAALIMFFAFFYTSIVFNPNETAENLKKYGGFVPGRRPGSNTAEYFDYVLTRITVIGAAYMSVVCILPEIMMSKFSIPFYLGGTSLLIVVNVITDTMTQVQTHLFSKQYEGLMNKVKLKEKRA